MSIHIHQYIVRFDVSEKNRHIQFLVGKNKYNQLIGKMEKTLKSPLDSKKIKPINPKGNQPWIFIWRTDAEAPILWLPDTGKELTHWTGKDWGQEEMRETEDEMVGWQHWLNGHEFEQTLGDGEAQGSLAVHGVANSWTWQSDWTTTEETKAFDIYVQHRL